MSVKPNKKPSFALGLILILLLLAAVILCGNTLLLEFLVNMCSVNQMLAKVITEIVFFILSWSVQRLVVFKKRAGGDGK